MSKKKIPKKSQETPQKRDFYVKKAVFGLFRSLYLVIYKRFLFEIFTVDVEFDADSNAHPTSSLALLVFVFTFFHRFFGFLYLII